MGYRLQPHLQLRPRLTREQRRARRQLATRRTLSVLPTLCTLGNLLCGFMAVFFASRPIDMKLPFHGSPLSFAAIFIFVGMLFDALDGRIARLTRSVSDLGEQLDSMADMVTFGVAPAFIVVQLIGVQGPFVLDSTDHWFDRTVLVIAALYVCCAALRLARFNVEIDLPSEKDHTSFKGLPSPAAAGTIASLVLVHQHLAAAFVAWLDTHPDVFRAPWGMWGVSIGMVAVMALVAFAMVSRLRYVHFVNRFMRGRRPASYIAKAVAGLLILTIRPQESIAAVFVIYALSAPLVYLWQGITGSAAPAPATEPAPTASAAPASSAKPASPQAPPVQAMQ
jgi:CDP-diacylglycerol--serine O-phosphatidyltransferase